MQSITVLSTCDHMQHMARQIARSLYASFEQGVPHCISCIFLQGDVGAGKSTFARAFVQALMGQRTVVPSPTFTIMQTYDAPLIPLVHMDLYRIEHPSDLDPLGFDDILKSSVCLIEWPEHMGETRYSEIRAEKTTLHISIDETESTTMRRLTFASQNLDNETWFSKIAKA